MLFALSVLALVVGPMIYALGRRKPQIEQVLNGFVFIAIAGIVCVHILPEAIETGGLWSLAFALLGLLFPALLERRFHAQKAHSLILVLAALGLVVHATIDGIALLPLAGGAIPHGHGEHGGLSIGGLFESPLALGVILHRLPVGMAIWWSIRPAFGTPAAIGTFAAIVGATAVAYFFGAPLVRFAEAQSLAYFQAFVAGSLVHVIAFGVSHGHDAHIEPVSQSRNWGYRIGILLGLLLMFANPHAHE